LRAGVRKVLFIVLIESNARVAERRLRSELRSHLFVLEKDRKAGDDGISGITAPANEAIVEGRLYPPRKALRANDWKAAIHCMFFLESSVRHSAAFLILTPCHGLTRG
jgi:hypothetical protein